MSIKKVSPTQYAAIQNNIKAYEQTILRPVKEKSAELMKDLLITGNLLEEHFGFNLVDDSILQRIYYSRQFIFNEEPVHFNEIRFHPSSFKCFELRGEYTEKIGFTFVLVYAYELCQLLHVMGLPILPIQQNDNNRANS